MESSITLRWSADYSEARALYNELDREKAVVYFTSAAERMTLYKFDYYYYYYYKC